LRLAPELSLKPEDEFPASYSFSQSRVYWPDFFTTLDTLVAAGWMPFCLMLCFFFLFSLFLGLLSPIGSSIFDVGECSGS
jgi:hypothetical protein